MLRAVWITKPSERFYLYYMRICNFTESTVLKLAAILGVDGNKFSVRLKVYKAVYKLYIDKLQQLG
jgi:hypothetical protein